MIKTIGMLLLGPFYYLPRPLTFLALLTVMALLTVLTQVGGLILWGCLPLLDCIRGKSRLRTALLRIGLFAGVYTAIILFAVPPLAALGGRVPLPWRAGPDQRLKPVNPIFCLMARNYVRPSLKTLLLDVSRRCAQAFPGAVVVYLDANFPFWNGFPLLPHLSHQDGCKVDLAYFYQDADTHQPVGHTPSPIGYWAYEAPAGNEAAPCRGRNSLLRWDFNWLQPWFAGLQMDPDRTRFLLRRLAGHRSTGKILLEPHLKARLGLKSSKIRFQGCRAARHDDHIHLQL